MKEKKSKQGWFAIVRMYTISIVIGACLGVAANVMPDSVKEFFGGLWHNEIYGTGTGFWWIDTILCIIAFVLAYYLQIILHEGGHLFAGLMSGYGFVSFRIGSFVFMFEGRKIKVKRFAIAGTGGQCLMSPPDGFDVKTVPYIRYNIGGVLANCLASAVCFWILWMFQPPFPLNFFLAVMCFLGMLFSLMNGIPMKISGIANDTYNILMLRKDMIARRAFMLQLKANALLSQGTRLREMPEEWFVLPPDADFNNYLHVSIKMLEAGRLQDLGEQDEARRCLEELEPYLPRMIRIYRYEILCELAFYKIISDESREQIDEILTPQLKKYATQYSRFMLSKKRLLYAYALFVEKDNAKARQLYEEALQMKDSLPLKAEAESEIEMMERLTK
ncbi:hypothetical protein M2132_001353 [Dysgonomonas sp. PH5-45]|uniref:hypothetical protein n=1 Tax=unclassified Dysgonomonas TaxID=2630389 RepID=UPI00247450BA|nr:MULTISPECIES: hypothetical protein [unclassified Dysgonomonas]MDH6355016.1 hypothetical protein [Dysgonomonas sp. PH5-45]MDH6387859.1 hypothetical protein [Dysgonomonas sp. PH5-37]